tara:strand:- start:1347 stop:1880 length:534 start_codon:yes stop_codon:yes gene_type:complete
MDIIKYKIILLLLFLGTTYADETKKPIRTFETIELSDLAHKSYKVRKIAPDLLLKKAMEMEYNAMSRFFNKCVETYKTTKDIEYKFNLKTLITYLYFPVYEPYARKVIVEYHQEDLIKYNIKFEDIANVKEPIIGPPHKLPYKTVIIEKEIREKLNKDFEEFCKTHKINIKEAKDGK